MKVSWYMFITQLLKIHIRDLKPVNYKQFYYNISSYKDIDNEDHILYLEILCIQIKGTLCYKK